MLELIGALMLSAALAQPPAPELSLAAPTQPITAAGAKECQHECYANNIGECSDPPDSAGYQQCSYGVVQECRCVCYGYDYEYCP